jgi:hypothetical protein
MESQISTSKKLRTGGVILAVIAGLLLCYWVYKQVLSSGYDYGYTDWKPELHDYVIAGLAGLIAGLMAGFLLYGIVYGISMLVRQKCSVCHSNKTEWRNGEGELICDVCARKQRMDAEKRRICPDHPEEVMMEKVHLFDEIIIDRCPTCQGVFLDNGELQAMQNKIQSTGSDNLTNGLIIGMMIG